MEYPTLDTNTVLFKIFEKALSPYYDIVWSFDYYATSIPANSQLGICLFLQDQSGSTGASNIVILTDSTEVFYPTSPGGDGSVYLSELGSAIPPSGIDLGYSGTTFNVDKGIIGVGLDTTGCFALSASSSGTVIRDGANDNARILNSLSIRGVGPAYSWNDYSVNIPLSTYGFNIIEARKKTIRARLGNVGQTLYIDYRYSPFDEFVNILTQDVTFAISLSSKFRPGVTFVKPVSGVAPVPVIRFSNFTIEGKETQTVTPPVTAGTPFVTPPLDDSCLVTSCVYNPYVPPIYEPYTPAPTLVLDPAVGNRQHTSNIAVSVDRAFNLSLDNGYITYDLYNFGYSLLLDNTTIDTQYILNRTDYFTYATDDSVFVLSLSSFDDTWKLIGPGINYTNNSNQRPIGTFSNYTISYINE
jgi:hypothetical protein